MEKSYWSIYYSEDFIGQFIILRLFIGQLLTKGIIGQSIKWRIFIGQFIIQRIFCLSVEIFSTQFYRSFIEVLGYFICYNISLGKVQGYFLQYQHNKKALPTVSQDKASCSKRRGRYTAGCIYTWPTGWLRPAGIANQSRCRSQPSLYPKQNHNKWLFVTAKLFYNQGRSVRSSGPDRSCD